MSKQSVFVVVVDTFKNVLVFKCWQFIRAITSEVLIAVCIAVGHLLLQIDAKSLQRDKTRCRRKEKVLERSKKPLRRHRFAPKRTAPVKVCIFTYDVVVSDCTSNDDAVMVNTRKWVSTRKKRKNAKKIKAQRAKSRYEVSEDCAASLPDRRREYLRTQHIRL